MHPTSPRTPSGGAPHELRPRTRDFPGRLRVLDPLRLRLLLEVDRQGSISAAAAACALGQPTASAHLRTLESALGVRLYERAGRATRLTDAGRAVARHGEATMSMLESLEHELAAQRGAVAGTLRVASCDGFGESVLPVALAAFAAERPQIGMHVHIGPSGDVLRVVARGECHLGVAGERRRVAGLVTTPLMQDRVVGIAPRHTAGRRGRVHPAVLEQSRLIVSTRESSTRALTEWLLRRLACRPTLVELDSTEAVKRAVRSGLGVAFVSQLAVAEELARGELTTFELEGVEPIERQLELVRAQTRRVTPLEAAFEQTLRQACSSKAAAAGAACG